MNKPSLITLFASHDRAVVWAIFIVAVAVRLLCFSGLIGSDDLTYNRMAHMIATGTFSAEYAHRETRLGLTLPVAGLFALFGVHEWSSAILPFLCFVLTFWVVVSMARSLWGGQTAIIAALLYTFLPLEMYYATILLPDLPAAACIAISSALFYHCETHCAATQEATGFRLPTWFLALIAGMALGWAFLIRETAIFFGIFVAGYTLYCTWRDKAIRLHRCLFWVGVLMIIAVEMTFYWQITGNPLFRYMAVTDATTTDSLAQLEKFFYVPVPMYVILDRLRALFLTADFGFHYPFVIAGCLYGFRKRIPHWGYVIGWLLSTFALYSFGSTSFSYYAPMRTVPRYFLALSVPAILIMSKFFADASGLLPHPEKRELRRFFLALFVPGLIMGILIFLWFSALKLAFLAAIIVLCGILAFQRIRTRLLAYFPSRDTAVLLPAFLVALSLMPGFYTLTRHDAMRNRLADERELVQVFEQPLQHTVYTDQRTEKVLEYFYHYQQNDQILEFSEAAVESLSNTYLVANWKRLFFLQRLYGIPIPDFLQPPPPTWVPFAKIGGNVNPCLVYVIPPKSQDH